MPVSFFLRGSRKAVAACRYAFFNRISSRNLSNSTEPLAGEPRGSEKQAVHAN